MARLIARVHPGSPRTRVILWPIGMMPQPDYLIMQPNGSEGQGEITAGFTDDGVFSGDSWAPTREEAISEAERRSGVAPGAWVPLEDTPPTDHPHLDCLREAANALLVRAGAAMRRAQHEREEHRRSDLDDGCRHALGEALSILESKAILSLGSASVVGLGHIDIDRDVLHADVSPGVPLPALDRPCSDDPLPTVDDSWCEFDLVQICDFLMERAVESRGVAEGEGATQFDHGQNRGYAEVIGIFEGCLRLSGISLDDIGWSKKLTQHDVVARRWGAQLPESTTRPPPRNLSALYVAPCCAAMEEAFHLEPPILMPQRAMRMGRATHLGIALYYSFDPDKDGDTLSDLSLTVQLIDNCPWCGRTLPRRRCDIDEDVVCDEERRATHAGITIPTTTHRCLGVRYALASDDLYLVADQTGGLLFPRFKTDVPGGSLRGDGVPLWYCPWDGELLGRTPPTPGSLPEPVPLPPGTLHPRY